MAVNRSRLILLISVAAAAFPTSTAFAATVERVGDEVHFIAAPGEANHAQASVDPELGLIIVRDYENLVTPGAGCTARSGYSSSNAVQCPSAGVTHVRYDLGDGDDSASGSDEPGTLALQVYGGAGNDALTGSGGVDLLDGGEGRDSLSGGLGKDVVLGGAGNDDLSDGDSDADRVEGGAGDDDFYGGVGPVNFKGGPGDDNLIGGDGNDELDGGAGDDSLVGGRGDDTLVAGPGDDDVDGGRGADRIDTADAQAEHTLTCGQGADRLVADGDDPVNVDCETFDGGRVLAGSTSVSLPVACPGGCTSGRVVLTAGGKRLGAGKVGRSVGRVRFNRSVTRRLTVRATIIARDSAGRTYRSRGRYQLR